MNYLSIIRRSDFNDLYKYGHIFVHNAIPFDGELSEHEDDKTLFNAVTSCMNTFEYPTEYLLLHICRDAFMGNSVEIFTKDIAALYALNPEAHAQLSVSLDTRINLQISCWSDMFTGLMMKQSTRQAKAGVFNCHEIFGLSAEERNRTFAMLPKNFVEDLFADLFAKKRPSGDKSIWAYLIRYERHVPYWNDERGLFSDAIHVYENFLKKEEIDYEIADELPIGDKLTKCRPNFFDIMNFITSQRESEKYRVDGCNYIVVATLYLYMKNLFRDGGLTTSKLMSDPNLASFHQRFGFDFAFAVTLLGITLGQEQTYSCYYEMANLNIFNKQASHSSRINNAAPLIHPQTGETISNDTAQALLNEMTADLRSFREENESLMSKITELSQKLAQQENLPQPQDEVAVPETAEQHNEPIPGVHEVEQAPAPEPKPEIEPEPQSEAELQPESEAEPEPEPETKPESESSFEPVKMIKLKKDRTGFYSKNSKYYEECYAHTEEEFLELKRKRFERYDFFDKNSIF